MSPLPHRPGVEWTVQARNPLTQQNSHHPPLTAPRHCPPALWLPAHQKLIFLRRSDTQETRRERP